MSRYTIFINYFNKIKVNEIKHARLLFQLKVGLQ
jgi:hypothetical protein